MPRLFVPAARLAGSSVELSGQDHQHVVKVLRLGSGAEIVLFDGAGTEIVGCVGRVSARAAEIVLGARRVIEVNGARVTLLLGVARGERMDLAIQKTTEVGVSRIIPVVTSRSVARPDPGGPRARRWSTIATEAARQCGRADVPEIAAPGPLGAALANLGQCPGRRLVLWEEERGMPFRQALGTGEKNVILLVGPEGGLAAVEIAQCRSAGFVAVGLGPRIMRVETAATVAVALAQAACGGLD